jgi:hypothetical protein
MQRIFVQKERIIIVKDSVFLTIFQILMQCHNPCIDEDIGSSFKFYFGYHGLSVLNFSIALSCIFGLVDFSEINVEKA